MPGRDLLQRFRPAGAPGGAAPVGVPADLRKQLEDELSPVLGALADVAAQVADLRAAAEREAQQIEARAASDAQQAIESARLRAPAVRAYAAGAVHDLGAQQVAAVLGEGRSIAAHITEAGTPHLDALVDAAIALLLGAAAVAPEEGTAP